ncbi:tripartite tricarboxylate transporter substrate binding protein [Pigmentiphaga litoralis]|uniref:tripartite tricarboxylate transporter substrate binding protein n=1 Tax=Pigmentiphaga litoralis TaxID=516702 RepID=UPI003B436C09
MTRLPLILPCAALAALAFATGANAADAPFPARPVKLIVAQAAGGGPDVLARLIAQELGEAWKQPVIVENKLGAAGAIAAEYAARAPADGYTLFVASAGIMTIAPAMDAKLPYTPAEFSPLIHLASLSNVFVVNSQSPVKTMPALVDKAKQAPTGLSFASMGPGSTGQISGEMLVRSAGVKIVQVAYKGEAQAVTDIRGGHLDFMAAGLPVALPQVKAGALTPLAVTGSKRTAALPDVPTMNELGYTGYDVSQWYALYAPVATPRPVQEALTRAVQAVLAKPAVQKQVMELGMDLTNDAQKDFAAFDRAERAKWAAFMKAGGDMAAR